MRVRGGSALLIATALVVLVIPATGNSPSAAPGSLEGRVISDLEEEPISGAQVVVGVPGGGIVASARSGADGRFLIEGIPGGDYEYGVTKSGFNDLTGSVTVSGGVLRDMGDLVLHPNPDAVAASQAAGATSWYGALIAAAFIALSVLVFAARHSKRLLSLAGKAPAGVPVAPGLPPRTLPGKTVQGARRVAAMRRERVARLHTR